MPVPVFFKSSRKLPSPTTVVTETVYALPLPVTAVIAPDAEPVAVSEKSLMPTPVTLSEKVTVYCTLVALEGEALTRLMELTVGGVVSPTASINVSVEVWFRLTPG